MGNPEEDIVAAALLQILWYAVWWLLVPLLLVFVVRTLFTPQPWSWWDYAAAFSLNWYLTNLAKIVRPDRSQE